MWSAWIAHKRSLIIAAAILLPTTGGLTAQTTGAPPASAPAAPPAPATLAGTVHDAAGKPVADVEVTLRELQRTVRTTADGAFTLAGVAPGAHEVWFRRLGYYSTSYTWTARAGERTTVTVALRTLPRTLDPVVVRAEEDRAMRYHSSIGGYVVDSLGQPVPEAEVQLIGADRTGVTRSNGGFLFSELPLGKYVIRVRKLGYAPNIATVQLTDSDAREVAIRIRPLPVQLDAVQVEDQSGYGRSERAWDELERRKHWHASTDIILGPDDMRRFKTLPLDMAMIYAGVPGVEHYAAMKSNSRVTSIRAGGTQAPRRAGGGVTSGGMVEGDACILVNGTQEFHEPLRLFSAKDVDMIEVYPSGTDPTETVWSHMSGMCKSDSPIEHPTYYVIWLKDAK